MSLDINYKSNRIMYDAYESLYNTISTLEKKKV